MINNTISIAEYKLKLHFENGENSKLSIQEVAELMDVVRFGLQLKSSKQSIFFSYNFN
jgi:hypothetical protein